MLLATDGRNWGYGTGAPDTYGWISTAGCNAGGTDNCTRPGGSHLYILIKGHWFLLVSYQQHNNKYYFQAEDEDEDEDEDLGAGLYASALSMVLHWVTRRRKSGYGSETPVLRRGQDVLLAVAGHHDTTLSTAL